jgi:hypothetical protein
VKAADIPDTVLLDLVREYGVVPAGIRVASPRSDRVTRRTAW